MVESREFKEWKVTEVDEGDVIHSQFDYVVENEHRDGIIFCTESQLRNLKHDIGLVLGDDDE